VKAEKDCIT